MFRVLRLRLTCLTWLELPWHFVQLACWTRDIWRLGKLTDIIAVFGVGSKADLWATAVDSLWRDVTWQSAFWQCQVMQLYSVGGKNRIFVDRLQQIAFWRQVCVFWRSISCTLFCFQAQPCGFESSQHYLMWQSAIVGTPSSSGARKQQVFRADTFRQNDISFLDATMIYWSIRSAQHVSGKILPIIRSVRLRYLQHMVSCCCGG